MPEQLGEALEHLDRLGILAKCHQRLCTTEPGKRTGKRTGRRAGNRAVVYVRCAPERLQRVPGTVGSQQPCAPRQPGGCVVAINGKGAIEDVERPFVVAVFRSEVCAEVGPTEIRRIEGFGLLVGGDRLLPKAVNVVGHPQAPA